MEALGKIASKDNRSASGGRRRYREGDRKEAAAASAAAEAAVLKSEFLEMSGVGWSREK